MSLLETTAMAYSNFTKEQAGVLYAQNKNGNIVMTDAAIRMMYERVDAYINHDVVLDDIEAKLRNATDAAKVGDFKTAQEFIDLACKVHDCHFDGERTARVIDTPKKRMWGVVDTTNGNVEFTFTFDDDGKEFAEEIADRHEEYEVREVFA